MKSSTVANTTFSIFWLKNKADFTACFLNCSQQQEVKIAEIAKKYFPIAEFAYYSKYKRENVILEEDWASILGLYMGIKKGEKEFRVSIFVPGSETTPFSPEQNEKIEEFVEEINKLHWM